MENGKWKIKRLNPLASLVKGFLRHSDDTFPYGRVSVPARKICRIRREGMETLPYTHTVSMGGNLPPMPPHPSRKILAGGNHTIIGGCPSTGGCSATGSASSSGGSVFS